MATAIPTLYLNQPALTRTADKLVYLTQFAMQNPGLTSEFIEHTLCSARFIAAETDENIEEFPGKFEARLMSAISNIAPGYKVRVSAEKDDDIPTRYNIVVRYTDPSDQLVISLDDFILENGRIRPKSVLPLSDEFVQVE